MTSTGTTAATATAPATPAVKIATGRPLTLAQWRRRGDAICAQVNAEVKVISFKTPAQAAQLLPQIALYYSGEASALSRLVPPASMAGDDQRLVDGLRQLSETLQRSGQALQAGDITGGSRLFRTALSVQRQPIAVAARDGFRKCTATN